ncbi:MAG TPA: succinate dehydrogenase assembly factor 2 [Methylococcaceae bacterium]|nr:succinate dehydrogenase assembly factor 2 [Methylococcaceae bacterium]
MSELAKLRWRCRRGTLELDILLSNYLEYGYLAAGDDEKKAFLALLNLEDSVLLPLLMGDCEPAPGIQAELIAKIRGLMQASR